MELLHGNRSRVSVAAQQRFVTPAAPHPITRLIFVGFTVRGGSGGDKNGFLTALTPNWVGVGVGVVVAG